MNGSTFGNIFKITTWGESHGKAIGVVIDGVEALLVVGERIFDRGHGVLADVDPEDAAAQTEAVGGTEVLEDLLDALVVEAHAVDDAARGNEAEETGLGVAGLGERRDRTDFDVAEAETAEGAHARAVLVHAGRKTDRVGKANAHDGDGIVVGDVGDKLVQTHVDDPVEIGHRDRMRHFGIHRKENASGGVVEHGIAGSERSVGRSGSTPLRYGIRRGSVARKIGGLRCP